MSHVFITGITGMDGSLLADQLLAKGWEVFGFVRRSASPNYWRLDHLRNHPHFHLVDGDVTSPESVDRAIKQSEPEIVFNLAAQSFVPYSWSAPVNTFEINTIGTINILESIRKTGLPIKFYQASSSEMFGKVLETPQKETTQFYPRSPYGISKVAAHYAAINYRESFGMHCSSGILFNHEHERRGEEFISRKITKGMAKIFANKLNNIPYEPLKIGNLEAKRDWGYAEDYVRGMISMMQHPDPDTFILATGVTRTIRDLCETAVLAAVESLGLIPQKIMWEGTGENEKGNFDGQPLIVVSKEFYRPAEVDLLLGDASKANKLLGWSPRTTFEEMIFKMFRADFNAEVLSATPPIGLAAIV